MSKTERKRKLDHATALKIRHVKGISMGQKQGAYLMKHRKPVSLKRLSWETEENTLHSFRMP